MAEPDPDPPPIGDDSIDAGLRALFRDAADRPSPGARSVLTEIRERAGGTPRILLRDAADDDSSVVRPAARDVSAESRPTDRYQLFGELARGGMGVVFKGRDADLGREVALKVLGASHAGRPDVVRRFVEEAQIGGQLQHPGIVPVYDLGLLRDGRPFFSMKLVKGKTLAALLDARPEPAHDRRRFLGIFEQVCQTMAYAHARGVVHRDLKPSNVMVGAFGEVQIMDWGLSKVLASGGVADDQLHAPGASVVNAVQTVRTEKPGTASMAGTVLGTPAYMSPEQARGDVAEVDERSDVFGLGAILCEILTGRAPFFGDTVAEITDRAKRGDVADAVRRLDQCGADDDLIRIAKSCLAPVKRDRPREAGVVAKATSAYVASVEERSRVADRAAAAADARAASERRARKLTVALASFVVAAVVLGGGLTIWVEKGRRDRDARSTKAVSDALRDATVALGLAKSGGEEALDLWGAALAAAQRAEATAQASSLPDATLLAEVEHVASDTVIGDGLAREARARAERDRRMIDRLDELRLMAADRKSGGDRGRSYSEAFAAYGIDVLALDTAAAASRIRESRIAVPLATALDGWARDLKNSPAEPEARWKHVFAIAQAADSDSWRRRLRDAVQAGNGDALRALQASADVTSLPPVTLALLGEALTNSGDVGDATTILRRAVDLHPDDVWLQEHLAIALHASNPARDEEALRHASAAVALRPRSPMAWSILGGLLGDAGFLDDAVSACRRGIELDPNSFSGIYNLGLALEKKSDVDGAIEQFRRAIALAPEEAESHAELGYLLRGKNDLQGSLASLRRAVELNPKHSNARYQLALTLDFHGDVPEAIASYREAIRLDPQFPRAHFELAVDLERTGDVGGAIAEYREAVRLDPDLYKAHANLARALQTRGQFEEAAESLKLAGEAAQRVKATDGPS
ncbi:MAG: tetratricopeptide repeat protein, partial [Planctomycetes bacterium]|nr:tetratricopeptide repeat protein [Planctomycetota bacterium]